jgi:hypothetical protein
VMVRNEGLAGVQWAVGGGLRALLGSHRSYSLTTVLPLRIFSTNYAK